VSSDANLGFGRAPPWYVAIPDGIGSDSVPTEDLIFPESLERNPKNAKRFSEELRDKTKG
jgi:hypothetical protein